MSQTPTLTPAPTPAASPERKKGAIAKPTKKVEDPGLVLIVRSDAVLPPSMTYQNVKKKKIK